MFKDIDKNEKKVLFIAICVAIGHLLLIAYAAVFLHIGVPTCQPSLKLFQKSSLRALNEKHYEVQYVAKMWLFDPKTFIVPVGSKVDFFVTSADVNHGFHISSTNINLMAVPGVVNFATHVFDKPGVHHIVCHEYCGYGHQNMAAEIIVSEEAKEASFGEKSAPETTIALSPAAQEGAKLYDSMGCAGCHSVDGSAGVAPTFKGLFGKTEEMVNGDKILVDEAYLVESIQSPQSKIVKGHEPIMPTFDLTKEQVLQLVEYIKSLSDASKTESSSQKGDERDLTRIQKGATLYKEKACISCHSIDGSDLVGPTFKGLYKKVEEFNDGSKLVMDDSLLIESIKHPDKKVAKGYTAGMMPKLDLTEEETLSLVEYIKTLK